MRAGYQILKWSIIFILSFTTFNLFLSPKVESSIIIQSKLGDVYNHVNNLKNWPKWAVWWQKDPDMKTFFSSDSSFMSWAGSEYKGSLRLISSNTSSIRYKFYFDINDTTKFTYGNFNFLDVDNNTKVIWRLEDDLPFYLRFMKFFIIADFEKGLYRLKEVIEIR